MLYITLIACFIGGPMDQHRALFDAIRQVESGGNDRAVGDGGRSRGPMQISRAYWQDARVPWPYDTHVWSRWHSEQVMLRYWAKYGALTDEQKARCHNAGPRWRTRARLATDRYWRTVQRRMR